MEMLEVQENERRTERRKGERSEAVLQMLVRGTSDEKLLWYILRCKRLRKTSSKIATQIIQERGTKEKC